MAMILLILSLQAQAELAMMLVPPARRVVRADPLLLYLVLMMNRAPASQACEVFC